MNIDDLLCVGITDDILVSSTIGRNKRLIPGEVISAIIKVREDTQTHSDTLSLRKLRAQKTFLRLYAATGSTFG
jgi:hypothetical protein